VIDTAATEGWRGADKEDKAAASSSSPAFRLLIMTRY